MMWRVDGRVDFNPSLFNPKPICFCNYVIGSFYICIRPMLNMGTQAINKIVFLSCNCSQSYRVDKEVNDYKTGAYE